MASIFLSYDRDDTSRAKPIAGALDKAGHTVWWDDLIKGGSQYSNEIERALNSSDAVVVLWSERSVQSAWVRDEAAAGRDRGCLIPVLLDRTEPPLGFRQFQNIDLSRWNGRGKSAELRQLLDALPTTETQRSSKPIEPKPIRAVLRVSRTVWLAIIAAVILVGGYAGLRFVQKAKSPAVPVVAVVAADNSPAARSFARDVLVDLGSLQGAGARSLRLVDTPQQDADLVVEVAGAVQAQRPQASLILRTAADRSLLWSSDFQRPSGSLADLQPEVVNSAGLILQCAQDGLSADQPLKPELLKVYLAGCWTALGPDGADLFKLAAQFQEVTQGAPEFQDAWGKLLSAESELVRRGSGEERITLQRHIAQARRVNPSLPEIYLAEGALLPPNDVAGRIRLANEAVEKDPGNVTALAQRAYEWTAVGRMTAAVKDASDAARLEPHSPSLRDVHAYALQAAGQFDEARKETDEVARIWPHASQLWPMRFRTAYGYGDVTEARAVVDSTPSWRDNLVKEAEAAFLDARAAPTQANVEIAIQRARAVAEKWSDFGSYTGTLAVFGRTDEIFAVMDQLKNRPDLNPGLRDAIFGPRFRDFWRDPRSMRVAAQLGVLQYWRTSGNWPDFCYEPDQPYDCKAEAAKLPS